MGIWNLLEQVPQWGIDEQLNQQVAEEVWKCNLECLDGQVCNRTFCSKSGLKMHQRHAKIHGQVGSKDLRCLVTNNVCPNCHTAFSSYSNAYRHFESMQKGGSAGPT
eukprot:9712259-Karenia_brevis.AAC.1